MTANPRPQTPWDAWTYPHPPPIPARGHYISRTVRQGTEVCLDPAQLQNLHEDYELGIDVDLLHYLIPFGLCVLDTRCYAVVLDDAPGPPVLLPGRLLRLERKGKQPVSLKEVAKRVTERITRDCGSSMSLIMRKKGRAMAKEELVLRLLEQMQAQMTDEMDHTMETITEVPPFSECPHLFGGDL